MKIDLTKYKHYRLPGGWHVHIRHAVRPWPLPTRRAWRWIACTPFGVVVGHGRATSRWEAERAVQQAIARHRKVHGTAAGLRYEHCGDKP